MQSIGLNSLHCPSDDAMNVEQGKFRKNQMSNDFVSSGSQETRFVSDKIIAICTSVETTIDKMAINDKFLVTKLSEEIEGQLDIKASFVYLIMAAYIKERAHTRKDIVMKLGPHGGCMKVAPPENKEESLVAE